MKSTLTVFVLLFLFTALSLCVADIFSSKGLAQKQFSTSTNGAKLNEKIRRVENGLLMPFNVKCEPNLAMKLDDRMKFYKVPGVSVAIINNGKIE